MQKKNHPWIYQIILFALGFFSANCLAENNGLTSRTINEMYAFSLLKTISVNELLVYNEEGKFFTQLMELKTKGYADAKLQQLLASNNHSVNNYTFAEITKDESDSPINNSVRFGLIAYPTEKGSTDKTYLILIDMEKMNINEENPAHSKSAIQYWESTTVTSAIPWPSTEVLEKQFHQIILKTPQEGIKAARQLKEDFDKRQ
jgi:hypothetical protein